MSSSHSAPIRFSETDKAMMRLALKEAETAAQNGDVPVGAVLVDMQNGSIIATGKNTRELTHSVLGHAELNALSDGCAVLGGWRLSNCVLYVTLEPCPMCAGAILHARIPRIVYGAKDPEAGAMGTIWALHRYPIERKYISVEYGCLEEECAALLKDFFVQRRSGE